MMKAPQNLIGLYYPSIQFKDDAWVKLAALYWDKLGRIVPPSYPHEDSDVVKQLIEEADFIRDLTPSPEDIESTSDLFSSVLKRHVRQLKNRYSLDQGNKLRRDDLSPYSNISGRVSRSSINEMKQIQDASLTFIASAGKMTISLKDVLIRKGLAEYIELGNEFNSLGFIKMHPRLAFIYMEVLAEQMANASKICPVTDGLIHHRALSQYTLDRLTNTLLGTNNRVGNLTNANLANQNMKISIANIALKSIFPRDKNVPIRKILQLRHKYRDELTNFQNYLDRFVAELRNLQDIKDPEALSLHLTVEYEKNLKPQIDDLRRCLNSLGIDTAMGVLNIRATQPELAVSLETYVPYTPSNSFLSVIGAAGAVVYSVIPQVRQQRKIARDLIISSPAAYLLHIEEGLDPLKLSKRLLSRSILGI